jgi:tetratricopeptide (TPR) repeat protein
MFEDKGTGVGFLRMTKAHHAEEAIGHSEGLVTVLRLTQADLKPAEDALTVAKQFFTAHQYSKAVQAAKRAETIAISLDQRFGDYQEAIAALSAQIESMKRLGLATDSVEAVLGQAEKTVVAGVWDNGAFVPNYLEARSLLSRAVEEGRTLQGKAELASNQIFLAELAIEALANLTVGSKEVLSGRIAASTLEQTLHDATRELALGNAGGAAVIARDLEEKATRFRAMYGDAVQTLEETNAALAELRGEGVLTQALEGQMKMARDMIERGLIEPGMAMAARLRGEARTLGDQYRKATTTLGDAEVLYGRLQREGFHSYEADAALRDARRSIREGGYARAIGDLERALQAFARRTNARAALAKAIEETRTRVRLLEGRGLSFMPDIQEIMGRAEREFYHGNYSGASEDLRIATVLLDGVTKAPAKGERRT